MDDRTKKLLEIFGIFKGKYKSDEILNLEFNEFDSYRLFRVVSEGDPYNAKGYVDGILDSEISNYQKKKFNSQEIKLFRVSKEVNHLLNLTKPSTIEQLKLPFDTIFIDTDFLINEKIRIIGIFLDLITKDVGEEINNIAIKRIGQPLNLYIGDSDMVMMSCMFYSSEKGHFAFLDEMLNLNTGKIIPKVQELNQTKKYDIHDKLIRKKLSEYVLNLLLFLNEPRIVLYVQQENNKKRIRKGLIPIPSQLRTKIEIGLENYIQKIYFNGQSHSKLGFSFWVRGHWRIFKSERFVNKRGSKTWILPHISGEGLMPPQVFEITNKHPIRE